MIREGEAETIWARLHARQALVFGVLGSLALFIVLALPLVALLADPGMSTGTTITIYWIGLIVDVVTASALALTALRFSARAARGELFAIPIVTPIVDSVFRLRQS